MDIGENYFDEAYFQRGWERGTAYEDYLTSAASSPTFQEIARCIAFVFKPRRALEIGCATGPIVSQLNMLGVETYGIDISEWAVQNALHPNVMHASADLLPFQDSHFDLVYSSHSLEHLPTEIYQRAFREISRVCTANAFQFHMLPIIGTHPYDYDASAARAELKKDPTHNLLNDMAWWLDHFRRLGWSDISQTLNFRFDTDNAELSSGQFCLYRGHAKTIDSYFLDMARWNQLRFREILFALKSAERQVNSHAISLNDEMFTQWIGPNDAIWDDLKIDFDVPLNAVDGILNLVVNLAEGEQLALRVAILSSNGGVAEQWLTLPAGISRFDIDMNTLSPVSDELDLSSINAIYFGGVIGPSRVSAHMSLKTSHGSWSMPFKDNG